MLAGYPYFLRLARRLQWDAEAIDVRADARAWPGLDAGLRSRLLTLVAGFCVGEAQVAAELRPFATAAAGDPEMAACFDVQEGDERRHARFFDRVAAEVAQVAGETAAERRAALSGLLDPRFLALFEERLPAAARALAGGTTTLPEAVGLYHMALEGVVFTSGLTALRAQLDERLPGMREGVELVLRDERWHVGFGTRCLLDHDVDPAAGARIAREGEAAAWAWSGAAGDDAAARRAIEIHGRRLGVVGLATPGAVAT